MVAQVGSDGFHGVLELPDLFSSFLQRELGLDTMALLFNPVFLHARQLHAQLSDLGVPAVMRNEIIKKRRHFNYKNESQFLF